MSDETILLTGFPAQRARHLTSALALARPGARLLLLVHPERMDEARETLGSLQLKAAELLEGQATALDFGLSGKRYLELAQQITVIHAAYSVTDLTASEALAEKVNIGSTRELIEFGRVAPRLRALVYYSSAFVSGQRTGLVLETELEVGQSFRTGVEQSLAIAERMLRKSGLPSIVLRAGHLLGDTEHGAIEQLSVPALLMALVASAPADTPLPLPPGAELPLAITPIDYLAHLGASAQDKAAPGSTLHVVDPTQPTLRQFLELVAERCGKRFESGFNPTILTRALFGNAAARLLPQNARNLLEALTLAAEYSTEAYSGLVARGAPPCPPLESYVDRLLEHIRDRLERGTLSPVRRQKAPYLVT